MEKEQTAGQISLFDLPTVGEKPKKAKPEKESTSKKKRQPTATAERQAKARKNGKTQKTKVKNQAPLVSGQVPEGDVRLTANIRQDLHLKLKIEAAHRRTTIGELIEELVDKHL